MNISFIRGKQKKNFLPLVIDENVVYKKNCIMLGAVENDSPVGVMVMMLDSGIITLNWIFVEEKHRHKGIGSALINAAAVMSKELKLLAIKFDTYAWSEGLQSFFEKNDFIVCEEMPMYVISRKIAVADDRFKNIVGKATNKDIYPIGKLSVIEMKELRLFLQKDILGAQTLEGSKINYKASFAHKNKDGRIDACLISSQYDGDVCVDFIQSMQGGERVLIALIRTLFLYIKEDYNAVERIVFYAANQKIYDLANTLFPNMLVTEAGPIYGFLGIE